MQGDWEAIVVWVPDTWTQRVAVRLKRRRRGAWLAQWIERMNLQHRVVHLRPTLVIEITST